MTKELKTTKKKLQALYYDGVGLVIADVYNALALTLKEQMGMTFQKEGKEYSVQELFSSLEEQYVNSILELSKEIPSTKYIQKTLEQEIAELKQ